MKTMKKFLSMAALALVGAVMTGCSSDDSLTGKAQEPAVKNNVVTLTTTVNLGGDGTRALTDGGVKTFGEGDKIAVIYKNSNNETKKVESVALTDGNITNEGKSATFTVTLEAPKGGEPVRYIYPAAMAAETVETSTEVTADATINYAALASQDGTLATLEKEYDLAVFDGSLTAGATLPASSTLENKLAILAYTIKNADASSDLTNTITRLTVSDGPNTYGVTRTAAAGPVYVAILPTSDAKISIMAAAGLTTYTKCLTGKTYASNNIYKAGLKMTEVPGAIPGMFSISSDGKTVFSKGNLRYASGTWSFFDNQYDYYTSYSAAAWDKFGWSTSATTYGMSTSDSGYSGDFADWGSNAISNGGNTANSGWFTLSSDEWTYLFDTRSASTVGGTSNGRYAKAKVNNVWGVILFPDAYTHPSGVTAPVGINVTGNTGWNGNTYDATAWSKMETAGCVFLPAAGLRSGTSVGYVGEFGLYWSRTGGGPYDPSGVRFGSGIVYPADQNDRSYGFSVRLVRPVE